MENFNGIIALLVACLELVLILNMLIFSEKNRLNILFIFLVLLLMFDQMFEFIICYFGQSGSGLIMVKFIALSFIPAVLMQTAFEILPGREKFTPLLYLPSLAFSAYYIIESGEFYISSCTIIFAEYQFPGKDLLGIYFYSAFIISTAVLFFTARKYENHRNRIIIIFAGLTIAVLPATIAFLVSSTINEVRESLISKAAVMLALTLTYLSLKNKSSIIKKDTK